MNGRLAVHSRPTMVTGTLIAVLLLICTITACGARIPSDPNGTLANIETSHVMRVGATSSPGLVTVTSGEVSGPLATLIDGFAEEHEATVTWTVDSEERLVDALEQGEIDLAIGGMTDATVWADRVAVTRGYPALSEDGRAVVMFVPLGENELQSALESFLDEETRR